MRKSNIKLLTLLAVLSLGMAACGTHGGDNTPSGDVPSETDERIREIYNKAKEAGYEGTYEEWLQTIKGADGATILYGNNDPTSQQGKVGDIYINISTWDIFANSVNGWVKVGNIMGRDGEDGQDGLTPYIGQNGNWWIGETDTGVKAEGKDGKDGQDGDGKTPFIGQNGNWWIGDVDTGVLARGPQGEQGSPGEDGEDGEDGLTPFIGQNGNWWIGEKDTGVKAEGQDGKDGQTPTIGQNGNWWIGNVDTGIKAEGKDGKDGQDGKDGEKGDTAWSNTVVPSNHGRIYCNVGSALEGEEITFYAYAEEGYELKALYLNNENYIDLFDFETNSLTVKMVKNGYYVEAIFDEKEIVYDLSITGELKQGNTVYASLTADGMPYLGEYLLDGKEEKDREKVIIEDNAIQLVGSGEITLVAYIGLEAVSEYTFEVEELVISEIRTALDIGIKEASFNGYSGRNSAITETVFTVEGQVLALNDYKASTVLNVLIGDETGYLYLMVNKPDSELPFEIGDSVRVPLKLSNYFGLLEGVSPSSQTGVSCTYLSVSDFEVIEREFDGFEPVEMDGKGYSAYYERARQIASITDGTGTEYVDIVFASIPVEVKTINNALVHEVEQTGLFLSDTTGFEFDPMVEGQKSYLNAFIIGANTSKGKSNVMTVAQYPVQVTQVTIDQLVSTTLGIGDDVQLTYTTYPVGSYGEVTWTSTNIDVVAVDTNGKVTAIAEGEAEITVTIDGIIKNSVILTVVGEPIPAESISFVVDELSLNIGENYQLTPMVTPENATSNLIFTSSDEEVATVDEDGIITPIKEGTTVIKVQIDQVCAELTLTVTVPHGTLITDPLSISEAKEICAEIEGATSSNDVATALSYYTHGVITTGSYKEAYSNFEGSMDGLGLFRVPVANDIDGESIHVGSDVMVYGPLHNYHAGTYQYNKDATIVQYLSINQEKIDAKEGDEQLQLGIETNLEVETATSWASTNEEVVKVDENGLATIVGVGEAYIIASLGGFRAYCTVSVVSKDLLKETIVAANEGIANAQEIGSLVKENMTISFAAGTNKNAPKYYDTGSAFRLYGGNSMTVTMNEGYVATSIKLTFATGEGTNEITVDVGEYEAGVWAGEASEITFTVGGTSGQRRIAEIEIVYKLVA